MPGSMKSNKRHVIRVSSQVRCLLSNSVQEPGEQTSEQGHNTDRD